MQATPTVLWLICCYLGCISGQSVSMSAEEEDGSGGGEEDLLIPSSLDLEFYSSSVTMVTVPSQLTTESYATISDLMYTPDHTSFVTADSSVLLTIPISSFITTPISQVLSVSSQLAFGIEATPIGVTSISATPIGGTSLVSLTESTDSLSGTPIPEVTTPTVLTIVSSSLEEVLLTTPTSLLTTPSFPEMISLTTPSFLETTILITSLMATPTSLMDTPTSLMATLTSLMATPTSLMAMPLFETSTALIVTSTMTTTPSTDLVTTPTSELATSTITFITEPTETMLLITPIFSDSATTPTSLLTTPIITETMSFSFNTSSRPTTPTSLATTTISSRQSTRVSSTISVTTTSTISTTSTALTTPTTSATPTFQLIPPSPTPSPLYTLVPVVTVTVLNATAILIQWTPVQDSVGYRIYLIENNDGLRKRRENGGEIVIEVSGGHVTSHVISGLRPFTSYGVSMSSVDSMDNEGPRSSMTPPLSTDEAAPGPPLNVTWKYLDPLSISISWLPPQYPNGVISNYTIVILLDNGTRSQYTVPGNQTWLIITTPTMEFTLSVAASNAAGMGHAQYNVTEPEVTNTALPSNNSLSPGTIAAISVFCVLLLLLLVAAIATVLIIWSRKWYKYHGSADINVNEIEYKQASSFDKKDGEEEVDGQLTAKRWMRANANYGVPSLLLPPISDLVSTYKTAEDLVEAKTMVRSPPQVPDVLQTVGEPSATPTNEQLQSTSSSTDRSCGGGGSTMSSVYSAKAGTPLQTRRNPCGGSVEEEEEVERDSRLINDDQALFEMMENVYIVTPQEMSSMEVFEVKESERFDIKEQIGLGQSTKIMRAVVKCSSLSNLHEGNEVAVKILNDNADIRNKESFLGAAYIMSQFTHDNVLPLLGVLSNSQPLMSVSSYSSIGDLKHFLTRVRRKTRLESQPCNFGVLEQLLISCQIAAGMEYLAAKFFIHRAIQAKYILLGEDYSVKIGGFRMSHTLATPTGYLDLKTAGLLPFKWLAMETLINGRFTSNTDIWSFGVVIWEIFSFGLTPFRGVNNEDVLQHLKDGKRLIKPTCCPDNIYALMLHCWVDKGRDRPSFPALHSHLSTQYNNLKKDQSTNKEHEELSAMLGSVANDDSLATPISDVSMTREEGDSISADNSRVALLPDSPGQPVAKATKLNNCDLVLAASNGVSSVEVSEMEQMSSTAYCIERSASIRSTTQAHLYTKL